jgi:hypothetical protein
MLSVSIEIDNFFSMYVIEVTLNISWIIMVLNHALIGHITEKNRDFIDLYTGRCIFNSNFNF